MILPDDQGGFQVAVGGAYSYFEFRQPVSQRLTDEEWRAKSRAAMSRGPQVGLREHQG